MLTSLRRLIAGFVGSLVLVLSLGRMRVDRSGARGGRAFDPRRDDVLRRD